MSFSVFQTTKKILFYSTDACDSQLQLVILIITASTICNFDQKQLTPKSRYNGQCLRIDEHNSVLCEWMEYNLNTACYILIT